MLIIENICNQKYPLVHSRALLTNCLITCSRIIYMYLKVHLTARKHKGTSELYHIISTVKLLTRLLVSDTQLRGYNLYNWLVLHNIITAACICTCNTEFCARMHCNIIGNVCVYINHSCCVCTYSLSLSRC